MGLILVMGLSGVGKTTIIRGLSGKLDGSWLSYNFGEAMEELGRSSGRVQENESVMSLEKELHASLQQETARYLAGLSLANNLIIDTHGMIETSMGLMPGFTAQLLNILSPERIVLIEAPSEQIIYRRVCDSRKRRTDVTAEFVDKLQSVSLQFAVTYSCLSGALLNIIENKPRQQEQCSDELYRLITCGTFYCQ
jgi:adenylate kinase